jgi:nucleotide sugar dehydrogenase
MVAPVSLAEIAARAGRRSPETGRSTVCVQGLGFVGLAMAVAAANARDSEGRPYFNVVGVDLPSAEGQAKVQAINEGRMPIVSKDQELTACFHRAIADNLLIATTDAHAYGLADVTVVDVHLDLASEDGKPSFRLDGFRDAIETLGSYMQRGSLIIIETTVPPGTCARVAAPALAAALRRRGLPPDSILLAHSYERVMPGKDYYRSIVNFWRVYAGHTPPAADACEAFLSKIIDTKRFPLTRLHSTTASETAKVLENSYRAANIAFIEEWGRFAERVGIDLFEVIAAIRIRPTHSNIRQPGFGVGGYCLTKDPLFAPAAARQLFGIDDLDFPFSSQAVAVNARMPLHTLARVRELLGGSLSGKHILLLGVSYRNDVGDTRHSPSETLVRAAQKAGAAVTSHDPLIERWPEMQCTLPAALPSPAGMDAIVFAVPHEEYERLDLPAWLGTERPVIFDANHVLTTGQLRELRRIGCRVGAIGRGEECLEP